MKTQLQNLLKNKLLTDVIFSISVGMGINVISYIINVLLGNKLSPENFGTFNAVLSLVYIITLPTVTFQAQLTKAVAENSEKNLETLIRRNLKKFAFIALSVAALIIILANPISSFASIPTYLVFALALICFTNIFFAIPKGVMFGLQKIKPVHIVLLFEAGIRLIVSLIAAYVTKDVLLPTLAFAASSGISAIITIPMILNKTADRKKIYTEDIKFSESFYMMITYLLLNTGYTLDILLVNTQLRGEYAAVVLLGKIVFFAAVNINNVMFSAVTNQKQKRKRVKILLGALGLNLLITLGITLAYYLFNKEIVAIVFGGKYAMIAPHIAKMALGMAFYSCTFMLVNFLIAINKRIQIAALFLAMVTQVVVFQLRNDTLEHAVDNQLLVYTVFFVLNSLVVGYYLLKDQAGKFKKLPAEMLDPQSLP